MKKRKCLPYTVGMLEIDSTLHLSQNLKHMHIKGVVQNLRLERTSGNVNSFHAL
ncbi:hypothetical protein BRARA_A02122 [Brassica rapa]|uniref:Uncharacterized protein n=1 Tax=Brassica campestris TaxID=3711 RepID=A0A398AUW1_BRACM|nr:hypothetical protein BRARA_A02122 [Brassica rapa]